jgi:hypothetical protein
MLGDEMATNGRKTITMWEVAIEDVGNTYIL